MRCCLKDLTLADDFIFSEVMRQPENVKPLLESLLMKKIGRITTADKQKDIKDGFGLHGVRLDVCLEDEQQTQYDVEMQTGASYNLEKRIRYYQSSIDRRTLETSENYRDLRQSYVIFICTDDYYKRGLAVYKRKSVVEDITLQRRLPRLYPQRRFHPGQRRGRGIGPSPVY